MIDVFISYAHPDVNAARRLYGRLSMLDNVSPWFDKESLKPGQRWEREIERAIRDARYFLLLLSQNSTSRKGFYQREIRLALRVLEEYTETDIFLIPLRLDESRPHFEALNALHYVDLFPDWEEGLGRVLDALGGAEQASSDAAPPLRLRVHRAFFAGRPMEYYFVNAVNLSPSRTLEITHVWYEGEGGEHIPVLPPSRTLPIRLESEQSWETWMPVADVPEGAREDAYSRFRARLSTGEVFSSQPNSDVPPSGLVAGGPVWGPVWDP